MNNFELGIIRVGTWIQFMETFLMLSTIALVMLVVDINRRLERVMKRKRDNTSFYTFCEYQRINCSTAFFIPKRHRVAHFVSNFVALAIFALIFSCHLRPCKRSDRRKLKNTNCKLITLKILLKSRSVFSTFLLLLCFSWCLFLFSFLLASATNSSKP